eukprot:1161370-Pelagomonas_calceolata.AAC.5
MPARPGGKNFEDKEAFTKMGSKGLGMPLTPLQFQLHWRRACLMLLLEHVGTGEGVPEGP